MTTTIDSPSAPPLPEPDSSGTASSDGAETPPTVVAVNRRTIDTVLICIGIVGVVVLAIAAALLLWGNRFSDDYVGEELSSQNITFPSEAELNEEGRTDLLEFADQRLDTGKEAEAYASFINGHLEGIADGATYADLGAVESAAKADVTAAIDSGQPQAQIDELQATADGVSAQRNSLFKGETLRGLLLSAYAWSTVGMIAGIAALMAAIAAILMAVLVALGFVHLRRASKSTPQVAAG